MAFKCLLLVFFSVYLAACSSASNQYSSPAAECGEAMTSNYLVVFDQEGQKLSSGDFQVLMRDPKTQALTSINASKHGCVEMGGLKDDGIVLIKSPKKSQAQVVYVSDISGRVEASLIAVPEAKPTISCDYNLSSSVLLLNQYVNPNRSKFIDFYDLSAKIRSEGERVANIDRRPLMNAGTYSVDGLIRGKIYQLDLLLHDHVSSQGEATVTSCELDMDIGSLTAKLGDEIKEFRNYFGSSYGVVEDGYELNFYIEGGLKNVNIEYCLSPVDPEAVDPLFEEAGSCADLGLDSKSYIQSVSSEKLRSGFWNVRYRYSKGLVQKAWTNQKLVVRKVCSAAEYTLEEFNTEFCTDIDGSITIDQQRLEKPIDLKYVSVILGDLFVRYSYVSKILLPNLNFVSQVTLEENPTLEEVSFPNLKTISLDLKVWANRELDSFQGFSSLEKIGGDFDFQFGRQESFAGLEKLRFIGGDFTIRSMYNITDFQGLEALETISGEFTVTLARSLLNFDGLSSLRKIGSYFEINESEKLKNFDSLAGVFIGDDITIDDSRAINSLAGLKGRSELEGWLQISNIPLITNLDDLSEIRIIKDSFKINDAEALTDISGLSGLTHVGLDMKLYNVKNLKDLVGLNSLRSIKRNLTLDNVGMIDLKGLSQLEEVTDIRIRNNKHLTTLDGLLLNSFDLNWLDIDSNSALTDLGTSVVKADTKLEVLSVGSNRFLSNLSSLHGIVEVDRLFLLGGDGYLDYSFLKNLNKVNQRFDLTNSNREMKNLKGFDSLTFIGGDFTLRPRFVESLEGLNTLATVEGKFTIGSSRQLKDLSALDGLTKVTGGFVFQRNEQLQDDPCSIFADREAVVCVNP